MPLPTYLYHATSNTNAKNIAENGLQPRSVGGEEAPYLCMSGAEDGAKTLNSRANDVVFRVSSASLNAASWSERGAGKKEWRSTEGISNDLLEYRRNLGNASQTTWRSADKYPEGL